MARQVSDEVFSEFVQGAWPGLYRTAYLLLGDPGLAEDLVQTALAKTYAAWPKRARRSGCAGVRPNDAASTPPRRGSDGGRGATSCRPRPCPTAAGTTDPSDRPAVLDALAQLPPRQRAVVVLRYYEDLSVAETADALGCSEGTVKSQTSKSLDTLRRLLGDAVIPVSATNAIWEAPMTDRLSALLHEEADRVARADPGGPRDHRVRAADQAAQAVTRSA